MRSLLVLALLAVTLVRPVPAMAVERDTRSTSVEFVSESGDERFVVTVQRRGHVAAVCGTPCRVLLAPGQYRAEARSTDRELFSDVRVTADAPMRIRLGATDRVHQWAGLTLAAIGLSAGAIAVDHWRYLALQQLGEPTQPWISQYVDGMHGNVAMVTGVALMPLAAALLVPASRMLNETPRGVIAESARPDASHWRWTSVRFEPMHGGGLLGATLTF